MNDEIKKTEKRAVIIILIGIPVILIIGFICSPFIGATLNNIIPVPKKVSQKQITNIEKTASAEIGMSVKCTDSQVNVYKTNTLADFGQIDAFNTYNTYWLIADDGTEFTYSDGDYDKVSYQYEQIEKYTEIYNEYKAAVSSAIIIDDAAIYIETPIWTNKEEWQDLSKWEIIVLLPKEYTEALTNEDFDEIGKVINDKTKFKLGSIIFVNASNEKIEEFKNVDVKTFDGRLKKVDERYLYVCQVS